MPATCKDSKDTSADRLIRENVFTEDQYKAANGEETETPFTLTAFGNKELHEFLLSLNPSEVLTGPENKYADYFDNYMFAGQYLNDKIVAKIKKMYTFVKIVPAKENGSETGIYPGTRVATMEHPEYGRGIFIATISDSQIFYEMNYYIRAAS